MLAFARFMNSLAGRWTRVVGGIALIAGGLVVGGAAGILLAVVGVVPLLAGAFDICVLAPIIHTPFGGRKVRDILGSGDGIAASGSH